MTFQKELFSSDFVELYISLFPYVGGVLRKSDDKLLQSSKL